MKFRIFVATVFLGLNLASIVGAAADDDCGSRLDTLFKSMAPEFWVDSKGASVTPLEPEVSVLVNEFLSQGPFTESLLRLVMGAQGDNKIAVFNVRFSDEGKVAYGLENTRASLKSLESAAAARDYTAFNWILDRLNIFYEKIWVTAKSVIPQEVVDFVKSFPKACEFLDIIAHFSNRPKAFLTLSTTGTDYIFHFYDIDRKGPQGDLGITNIDVIISSKGKLRMRIHTDVAPTPEKMARLRGVFQQSAKRAREGVPYSEWSPFSPLFKELTPSGSDSAMAEIYFPTSEASILRTDYALRLAIHFLAAFERP